MNFDDPILAEESIVDEALLDIGEILVVGALLVDELIDCLLIIMNNMSRSKNVLIIDQHPRSFSCKIFLAIKPELYPYIT